MGVTFLQPLFLLGTFAAAIPVIIHLIYRRRALVHRFPAVRFLLLADKRTARKFRLHQWLLLALRALAVLCLALALARPHVTGGGAQAAAVLPPQATVLLIDNSVSMQYRDGQETRLQRAKALASQVLQRMSGRDSAVVMPLLPAHEATETPLAFSHHAALLQEQLASIVPSHALVDMRAAFQRAMVLLHDSQEPRRRLLLLSDLTMHGWEDFHPSQLAVLPEQLTVHVLRIGGPQRDANVLVTEVRVAEKPFIEHAPLEITAQVYNQSAAPARNVRVDLLVGTTTVGQQLVDLAPEGHLTVPFRIAAPPAGLHWGEVRIAGDNYAEDDQFYYALRTVAPVQVLLVDGDPGTSLFESDIFYVLHALQPRGVLGRPLFHPKPVPWEGLEQERLSAYQVVVLCNVETFTPQVRQRLHQFVMEGGGVVFFAGNRVDAPRYNAMLYRSDTALLPFALGQPLQRPPDQPMPLRPVQSTHEALTAFVGEAVSLHQSKFYRYMTLEGAETAAESQVLLALQDGHSLLVAKELGRGRVLFFTASADRDWTDLPTRPAYVPLLHGMVGYAAHLATAAQRGGVFLPEPARLPGRAEDLGATLTVHTPENQEHLVRFARDGAQSVAVFDAYTTPGIYRLGTPTGTDLLAVNGTRAESNFAKWDAADFQARLRPLSVIFEEEEAIGQAAASDLFPAYEAAGLLLLTLGVILAIENLCANRF